MWSWRDEDERAAAYGDIDAAQDDGTMARTELMFADAARALGGERAPVGLAAQLFGAPHRYLGSALARFTLEYASLGLLYGAIHATLFGFSNAGSELTQLSQDLAFFLLARGPFAW